ncbi:hypothetical protein M422DRAFT_246112 [Sphaerobolus stellatus SS14]|nr:hypothetical protein M422DRAFT_246112 [Sphaerobolus stellatus SS14]
MTTGIDVRKIAPLCQSYLLSLPTELAELIVAKIYSPADLLNLALTCKALHDIIIPFHLHFRKINLKYHFSPFGIAVWDHCITSVDHSFRTLNAHNRFHVQQDFYPVVLVKEGEGYLARTEMDPKSDHVFLRAVSHMTGLVKFSYTNGGSMSPNLGDLFKPCNDASINSRGDDPTQIIFPSLKSLSVDVESAHDGDIAFLKKSHCWVDYVPYLTRLINVTHVGGLNWNESSIPTGKRDAFLE